MKILLAVCFLSFAVASAFAVDNSSDSVLKGKMKTIDGKEVDLAQYEGKVVLFVNVASKCGLTPQYEALQTLHEKYAEKGLAIIGVPCNQFGGQEPGSDADIKTFCSSKYKVSFDMLSKVDVNGADQCDLYKDLTSRDLKPAGTGKITWNFEKFLLNKKGEPIARFSPRTEPTAEELVKAIEAALAE
jgi:glutathione peroxidase